MRVFVCGPQQCRPDRFVSCTNLLLLDRKQSIGFLILLLLLLILAVPWHWRCPFTRELPKNSNVTRVMRISVRRIRVVPSTTKINFISIFVLASRNHCLSRSDHLQWMENWQRTAIRFRFDLSVNWAFDLTRSNKMTTKKNISISFDRFK